MRYHIKDTHTEKSLLQLASTEPPVMHLEPVGFLNTNKALVICAAVVLAAAAVAAGFWTAQPEPPPLTVAAVAVKNLPDFSNPPVVDEPLNDSPALLSPLPATEDAGAGKDLRQIDELSGAELATAFDDLYKRAQAGDSELAYALGRRVRECASSELVEHQNRAANVEIVGMPNWAQTLDVAWRQRCIGLSVVQLDKASALHALAVKQGYPSALLEHASQSLNAIELAKRDALRTGQPIAQTPQQTESLAASVLVLDSLAQNGNLKALDTLAGLYAKGSIVDADAEKFLVYQLVSQHDWAQPAQVISQSPMLLAEEDAELKQKVLAKATELFNSCCANKEKTR